MAAEKGSFLTLEKAKLSLEAFLAENKRAMGAASFYNQAFFHGNTLDGEDLDFLEATVYQSGHPELLSGQLCAVLKDGAVSDHYSQYDAQDPKFEGSNRGFHFQLINEATFFDLVTLDSPNFARLPPEERYEVVYRFAHRSDDGLLSKIATDPVAGLHWFGRSAAWTGILAMLCGYGAFLSLDTRGNHNVAGISELTIIYKREPVEISEDDRLPRHDRPLVSALP